MKIKVKLVRSTIGRPKDQRATVEALGLRKLNHVVEHELNPAIQGMVTKVAHLVEVEELK